MASPTDRTSCGHERTVVTAHTLEQRDGVPYEVERVTCADCRQALGQVTLRRAAA